MESMSDCTQKEISVEESNAVDATNLEKKCTAEQYNNAPAEVVADEQKVMPVKGCNEIVNAEVLSDEETHLSYTQKVIFTIEVKPYKSRRQFTEEERFEVKRYFNQNIKKQQRIFIAEARDALESGALPLCARKTPKQIQDRVAEFIRSAQR
ncbi:uncharacterized protein LOC143466235, partial [Clavelina lepadiformis]|uniref:uncharacterized protein LOC143466235 n=1 Tax=Clavelina lepadiformis TaxID=159417 RepID=UPI0040435FC4